MNKNIPLYSAGPASQASILPQDKAILDSIIFSMRVAVGESPYAKVRPYRVGDKAYVSFDVEGTAGLVSLTIAITGNFAAPSDSDICLGRDPVMTVYDAVDAYYVINELRVGLQIRAPTSTEALVERSLNR